MIISPEDAEPIEIMIPKWRHISVFEGEHVSKGEVISDGPMDPHEVLRLKGIHAFAEYIINEIQEVYRLQGVTINDKHIETVVRQMLRIVVITAAGDSRFVNGEHAELVQVLEANDTLRDESKLEAIYEPILLGITKASLSTESFLSAASFQETTRVLTEASVSGQQDYLRGLKENVLIGRLIPSGTGLAYHQERKRKHFQDQGLDSTTPSMDELEMALSAALNADEDSVSLEDLLIENEDDESKSK